MVQEFSFNGLLLQLRIVSLSVAYCFSEIVLNIDYMAIFCVFMIMWSWWLTTVWKAIYYSACELWSVWSNVVAGKHSFLKELNFWFGLDLVSIVMATDLSIHSAVPVDMHFYEYSPSLYSCASSPLDRTTQAKLLLILIIQQTKWQVTITSDVPLKHQCEPWSITLMLKHNKIMLIIHSHNRIHYSLATSRCCGNCLRVSRPAKAVQINMSVCVCVCVCLCLCVCFVWLGILCVLSIETLHNSAAVHVWRVNLKIRWADSRRFMVGGKEMKKWWQRERNGHMMGVKDALKVSRDRERKKMWDWSLDQKKEWENDKESLRYRQIVVICMCCIYRSLWGRVLKPLCEVRWIGSINESVNHCVVMDPGCTHTHTHTHTHTLCSLSRLISLPIITPPIWHQPARSIMADNSVSLRAGLSISISPPLISYSLCISLFHTISPLSLSQPPHTTLSCLQTVSVSKLLKSYAYPILLCFLALLSQNYLSISRRLNLAI